MACDLWFGGCCDGGGQVLKKVVEVDGSHAWLVDVAGHSETEGVDRAHPRPQDCVRCL